MRKKTKKGIVKRIASAVFSALLLCGLLPIQSFAYAPVGSTVPGITVNGSGQSGFIRMSNFPDLDNTAKTVYYFGGNAFYGLERNGASFGENYDPDTWLLEDTDAMWDGQYLYSQYGDTGTLDQYVYSTSAPYY